MLMNGNYQFPGHPDFLVIRVSKHLFTGGELHPYYQSSVILSPFILGLPAAAARGEQAGNTRLSATFKRGM